MFIHNCSSSLLGVLYLGYHLHYLEWGMHISVHCKIQNIFLFLKEMGTHSAKFIHICIKT